ncbi:pyridoxal phosphate-dependent transferase [Aspergillus varians]
MAAQPLFPLDDFHPAPGITHLCAAGESLPLQSHGAAFTRYLNDKAGGSKGRQEQARQLDHVRGLVAESWNVTTQEIGFASSVADGISMLLESLHWQPGDNVVVNPDEFPSVVGPFAWKSLWYREGHGDGDGDGDDVGETSLEVRYARPDSVESVVDNKTRLIAISYVSYLTAARADLAFYRHIADAVGAILVVDYTQAAGYAPIDAGIADFAFSACYKWLMGTTGAAIAYWNQTRQPRWKPSTAGWHSLSLGERRLLWGSDTIETRNDAMCFSRGNPSHSSIYILRGCLEYLGKWEAEDIQRHVQGLTAKLLDLLEREGIPVTTPRERTQHGASVTIDCVGASEIVDKMGEAGVYAWNGSGRVRFSFHGYNCLADVDRVMEVFPKLWRDFNQ